MQTALVLYAAASLLLAGIGWVVQAVVYPAFALVPDAAWTNYHAAHGRRITVVVGPPWIVQGVATAALLWTTSGPSAWLLASAALGGVALTLGAVREHRRLESARDRRVLRRLLGWNLGRTLLWTAAGAAALVSAV